MSKIKIKPIYLIIGLVLIIFFLSKSGFFNPSFQAMLDMVDPATNFTYTCPTNQTWECYQKIPNSEGINLRCNVQGNNATCVEVTECDESATQKKTCWDNSQITLRTCTNNSWVFTNDICPSYECTTDNDCIETYDTDCDEELEPLTGTCSAHKCTISYPKRCTNIQLFWNKYNLYIIFGLILIGVVLFVYRKQLMKNIRFK